MIILDRLPFFSDETEVQVSGKKLLVRPYQLVFWASFTRKGVESFPHGTPHFPVIFDTGNNHNFSIQEKQLKDWTGLDPAILVQRSNVRIGGQRVPLFSANVWVHPNVAESRDRLKPGDPLRLELPEGIAVYPHQQAKTAVRLPTLGLRALVSNRLLCTVDGVKMRMSLLSIS